MSGDSNAIFSYEPRPAQPSGISQSTQERLIEVKAPSTPGRRFTRAMTEKVVKLDVREDIRQGREPFTRIMQAAAGLKNDEALLLIAPFEPVPLYRMMARQGFDHKSRTAGTGDWEVLFRRGRGSEAASESITEVESAPACNGTGPGEMVEVDARGLEPPQPLVTILEALATLPPGAQLRARTDRRPMHLYAQLQERGFVGETEAQADGSFITVVRRR